MIMINYSRWFSGDIVVVVSFFLFAFNYCVLNINLLIH